MRYNIRFIASLLFTLSILQILDAQDIQLTRSREINTIGVPATEYFFDATVNGIPTRKVQVNGYLQTDSKGTLILTSGGKGLSYYSGVFGEPSKDLIRSLHAQGLEIYEIKYVDQQGWAEHCEGIGGYKEAVQIYTELILHLHANYFQNKETIMATGNSGGSFQIAFGLTNFNLDSIMDMVILTGGPPISDLKNGIFGDGSLDQTWPNGIGGRALTDYLMGWSAEMYCENKSAPDSIISIVEAASLAAHSSTREYAYNTLVNFVQSDDPTNSHHQAKIYYDSIKTQKAWHYLPDIDIHAVPRSEEGAQKIEALVLEFMKTTSTVSEKKFSTNLFPNPASDIVRLKINNLTQPYRVSLSNLVGKTILYKEFSDNEIQIPVGEFSGVHFITITSQNNAHQEVIKVVIQ